MALNKRLCSWLVSFLSPLFLVSLPVNSYSWNATGHMVVASIAYQQLTPKAREKVDSMAQAMHSEYPNINSMLEMAVWPDSIRGQRIETFTHWHYINLPYSIDGTVPKNNIDCDNAVWAVKHIRPVVKNDHANLFERARFLSFLVHITGDLHQPLHAVALFSKDHPSGDRGGNSYKITQHGRKSNAHKLWDSGVGAFDVKKPKAETSTELANAIMQRYPKSSFSNKALNDVEPDHWAEDSLSVAKKYVYKVQEGAEPTTYYMQRGAQAAEKQAALAGYRLGNLLNSLLG